MNWLLVVVLIIIVFAMIRGFNRGFLRVLYSLVAIILLIVLVGYATPHVSQFLKENTKIYTSVSDKWADKIQNSMEGAVDSTAQGQQETLDEAGIHLPSILEDYIFGDGVQKAQRSIEETGFYQQAGNQMADIIVAILAFLLALFLAVIIVWIIGKATDVVNKIPIIKGINRFLGIFAGVFQGFIVVWLLFLFITMISGTEIGKVLVSSIEENSFLSILYNHNILLEIFSWIF